jgi:hypothetical protein
MDTLNLFLQSLVEQIRRTPERVLFLALTVVLAAFTLQLILQIVLLVRTRRRRHTAPTGDFQQQLEFALQREEILTQENAAQKDKQSDQAQTIAQQTQDLAGHAKEISALQTILDQVRQELGLLKEHHVEHDGTMKQQSAVLQSQLTMLQSQAGSLSTQAGAIQKGAVSIDRCLQRVGIVRYNSLPEMAGNQSFSVALLDETRTGMVFTSLQLRHDMRMYAKFIYNGRSEQPLSEEEKQAIAESISLQNNQQNNQ